MKNGVEVELDGLMARLAECPSDFLEVPRVLEEGTLHGGAVVHDLVLELGGAPRLRQRAAAFGPQGTVTLAHRRLALVACWLLADPRLRGAPELGERALAWIEKGLGPLSRAEKHAAFVADPDRREELSRSCLSALGLRPAGETPETAADRLASLDSVERKNLIEATRAQREKARELREAMRRKEAEEAAAKANREW
jgi:hypothetical protein